MKTNKIKEKLENIVRRLIILGYEMGKKQSRTPYDYTCNTDKGERFFNQILSLISAENQQAREELLDKVEEIMRDTLSADTLKYHKEVDLLYKELDKLRDKSK